jgi:hydrogenase maturation protease
MELQKPILILGIGNLLLKDEGIGVHVINRLREMDLPPDVEIMDGGTLGIDLIFYIEGRKKVIVIDTVKAGDPPGTLYRFTDKELTVKKDFLRTAHGIDFSDVVGTVKQFGNKPDEIVFIGVEPEDISEGLEPTDFIARRIPVIIELVMKELKEQTPKPGDMM